MKHNHTKREKGQALFLAALMVLSVFAMSASFAGAAAAQATNVTADNADLADEPAQTNIIVDHEDTDSHVYVVIDEDGNEEYTEGTDILLEEDSATDTSTEFASVDVSNLNEGTYTVYAIAGDNDGVAPSDGQDLSGETSDTFDVSDSSPPADPATTFSDQESDGITVTVDSVDLPEDGFVAIHSDPIVPDGGTAADSVIGVSEHLEAGTHTNVEVTLFEGVDGADFEQDSLGGSQNLFAMPHVDSNDNQNYDFVTSVNDGDDPPDDPPFFDDDGEIAGMDNARVSVSDVDRDNLGGNFYQGETFEVGGYDPGEFVQVREGTLSESDRVDQEQADSNGVVTIDTSDLNDAPHVLRADTADVEEDDDGPFVVEIQDATIEFEDDSVAQSSTSLNYESDNRDDAVDLEIWSEELDASDLADIFEGAEEYDDDVVVVSDVENPDEINADFSDVNTGEYNFTVSVADTTAEEDLSIEVTESIDADASFDSSTYSQTAGDIVEFTVEMDGGVDEATVELMEDDENYNATLNVEDNEGDGEVTVWFNTYNAGQGDDVDDEDVFWTDEDSDNNVTIEDETDFEGEFRLLPGDFDLELFVGDDETDVATLILTDRSTGDVEPGIAPADAEIEDADDIDNVTTAGSDVAEDDLQIIGYDINGIFGQLGDEETTADEVNNSSDFQVEIEHTNPGSYENANEVDLSDVRVIMDTENDRMFFVIDTSQNDISADQNYDVTLTVNEEYYDMDDDEEAMTSFSVVERMIEVTGEWDDDERLQVENSAEANVTGESTAAPGTDVQVRLRATGDDPFLMTETVEVNEDWSVDADFDLSDHEEGQNFTVRMTDQHNSDVQDEVDAVLVESTYEQDPHTVTITVEDADGNAVEGAEVEVDGQTETTDANGEAVFSLHHGEYDISATYDGEEATGTLTVDDETSDSGTLTLGEEDQQIPEEDPADENGDTDPSDENGDVDPDDENGDADPDDEEDPEDEDQPGFGIAVALIALLAAAGIALRNRA